jgi:hypothetical protein
VEICAGQYLGGSVLQPIGNLPAVAFRAGPIATAVVAPEAFMTVIALVSPAAHGLGHALGNIPQRPAV